MVSDNMHKTFEKNQKISEASGNMETEVGQDDLKITKYHCWFCGELTHIRVGVPMVVCKTCWSKTQPQKRPVDILKWVIKNRNIYEKL